MMRNELRQEIPILCRIGCNHNVSHYWLQKVGLAHRRCELLSVAALAEIGTMLLEVRIGFILDQELVDLVSG